MSRHFTVCLELNDGGDITFHKSSAAVDSTADMGIYLGNAVAAVGLRPRHLLASAITVDTLQYEGDCDDKEGELYSALRKAAEAYDDYWRANDEDLRRS